MIDNYEAWLIDYLDGKLDPVQVADLQLFVDLHPELGSWSDLTSGFVYFETEPITYELKNELKSAVIQEVGIINENNCHEYFVASVDNQLDTLTQSDVDKFIRLNPDFASDFALLKQTKYSPDLSIHFPERSSLKHLSVSMKTTRVLSYAASVLFLFGLFVWWMLQENAVVVLPVTTTENIVSVRPEIVTAIPENFSAKTQIAHIERVTVVEASPRQETILTTIQPKPALQLALTNEPFLADDDFILFYFDGHDYLASLTPVKSSEKKSLVGLVAQNLAQKAKNAISLRTIRVEEQISGISGKGNTGFWNIAELGLKTYNNLTDSELDLSRTVNADGKLTGVRFHSEQIRVNKVIETE
jgi:hypothetical protein